MKVEIVHVPRRPPWPLWAVFIVLVWSCLGGIAVWLSSYFNHPAQLCLVKNLTGVPCPTCGFTRGILCLLDGHILQAWLYNPLLFSVLALCFISTACRMTFACGIRISLTKLERMHAWSAAIVLFVSNWAYIFFREMKTGFLR
jgi:hypothetical protein